jgi:hypothetical protein
LILRSLVSGFSIDGWILTLFLSVSKTGTLDSHDSFDLSAIGFLRSKLTPTLNEIHFFVSCNEDNFLSFFILKSHFGLLN